MKPEPQNPMNTFVYNPASLFPRLSLNWIIILGIATLLLIFHYSPFTTILTAILVIAMIVRMTWKNIEVQKIGPRGSVLFDWIEKDILKNLEGFATSTFLQYCTSDTNKNTGYAIYFTSSENLDDIQYKIQEYISSLRDCKTTKNIIMQDSCDKFGIVNLYLPFDLDRRMIYVSEGKSGHFRLTYARVDNSDC